MVRDERHDVLDLAVTTDQAGQRLRQVAAPGIERADRREVCGESVDHELVEPLLAVQVLEPVVAEIAHIDPARQAATGERLGLRRQQYLPAMGRPRDAGRPVDVEPDIVVATAPPVAGMDPDADLDDRALRPRRGIE